MDDSKKERAHQKIKETYRDRLSNQEVAHIFETLAQGLETGKLSINLEVPLFVQFGKEVLFELKLQDKAEQGFIELALEWESPS